jgi:NADH-quinone oxidoreductase subunit F
MDLKWRNAAPTAREKAAVDEVLGPVPEGGDPQVVRGGHAETQGKRHLLLPVLHALQERAGWISSEALDYLCQRLTIPPAEAFGVASFYAMFSTVYRPPRVAHVCDDIACKAAGADELATKLTKKLGPPGKTSGTNGRGKCTWLRSPCLGLCERGPAVLFQLAGDDGNKDDDGVIAPATADEIARVLLGEGIPSKPVVSAPQTIEPREPNLRLLRRVGVADPESLSDYQAHGGYRALRRAISLGPEGLIREVLDSKMLGRGGAAFPMGRKWDAVAKNPVRPHYVLCNADESEPGTFKDRVLMEEDPFAIIEAMTIAGYAAGAEQGFLYIRGEYPLATERLRGAIDEARTRGLLGDEVMDAGFRFDIEMRRGAGAYICGEETALFNSIEGFRGEPRSKPPFPTQAGLFGKPTVVNNVETLVNVLDIVLESGPAFAEIGTSDSTGHKLFCVSGMVKRPGLYEVPFGTTLRHVLELAGGPQTGRPWKAILLGGAAGSFVDPKHLDVPLTFEGLRAIGASLGSGVVMPFDDTVDLTDITLRIAAFFRDETCGQCVPCRVGTVRQEEALQRLVQHGDGKSGKREVALIKDIAQVMRDASICGLGQTASGAVESAVALGLVERKGGGK